MIKKRTISVIALVLAVFLLVSCGTNNAGGTPTTVPQPIKLQANSNGFYEIHTAQDLFEMARFPDYKYVLKANIDMSGIDWVPISNFSGTFNGTGKTISNLTLKTTARDGINMGLFGNITSNGKVESVYLLNVAITATDTTAQNIGTVAGTVDGDIVGCAATGIIYDTRKNADGEKIYVGALAGKATADAQVKGALVLSTKDNANVHTTSGLAADVKMFVADSNKVFYGLVGDADKAATVTGLWRDSFYSSERLSEEMQQRQAKVVDYMYKMGTVAWTVPVEMVHKGDENKATIHDQTFVPGQTYYGIPYDHTGGSLEAFMSCMDENNQVDDWVIEKLGTHSVWNADDSAVGVGFTLYMGNDCSSAVGWAWMQVAPSEVGILNTGKYEGGSFVLLTTQMVPNKQNQITYGIYPVGNWDGNGFEEDKAAYQVDFQTKVSEIIEKNGQDVIYEAYAQARKGDGLIYGEPGGHARLLAEDPVVIRDAKGKIDVSRSYMIAHEQGDGLYNNKYQGTNSSWRINYRYTFDVLMNGSKTGSSADRQLEAGSGKGYLPITVRALRDEKLTEPVVLKNGAGGTLPITSPMSGSIYSNYRFLSTTVIVKDSSGKEIYNYEAYTGTDGKFDSFRGVNTLVYLSDYHMDALKDAPKGDYTFSVLARLTTGETFTVVENQPYEHK